MSDIGRKELVEALAKELDLSNAKANLALNTVIEQIQTHVARGRRVTIVGFGSFFPRKRAARKGRNPATGAAIKIKASTSPAFKAGAKFKKLVGKK